jgi:hypothetical protein
LKEAIGRFLGEDFVPNTRLYNTGMRDTELRALFGQPV